MQCNLGIKVASPPPTLMFEWVKHERPPPRVVHHEAHSMQPRYQVARPPPPPPYLWVNHKRPPARVVHHDGVVNAEGVIGQARDDPRANLEGQQRLCEHVADFEVHSWQILKYTLGHG